MRSGSRRKPQAVQDRHIVCDEELSDSDDEMGDLKASLLLAFVMQEIGPTIYNQAITDAQTRLQDAVMDLDGSCHEPDLGYWNKR